MTTPGLGETFDQGVVRGLQKQHFQVVVLGLDVAENILEPMQELPSPDVHDHADLDDLRAGLVAQGQELGSRVTGRLSIQKNPESSSALRADDFPEPERR